MPISKSKERANKKWNDKNKEKTKIYSYRSRAKAFITKYADKSDLDTLKQLIKSRENELLDNR